jgi:hypothetical protein
LHNCNCAHLNLCRKRLFVVTRRSILSPARIERSAAVAVEPESDPPKARRAEQGTKPSRLAKLHIGGYFDPDDATLIAFQKLRIDLRRSQQDMLFEALRDFVAKYQAESAFRK